LVFSSCFKSFFESLLVFKVRLLFESAFHQQFDKGRLAQPASSFAAAASYSCTFSKKRSQPGPLEIHAFLAFTTWSSVARFINSRANSRSYEYIFGLAALNAYKRGCAMVNVPRVARELDEARHGRPRRKSKEA